MRFDVGDIVRLAWHDNTNQPGIVVGLHDPDVQIWWPNLDPTPFIVRLQHDDGDLILYAKGKL